MIEVCRSCSSGQLREVLSLGEQYLSDFTGKDEQKPPKYPLDLVVCERCTLVQLANTTPPSLLYTDRYGYRSGINNMMKKELREITLSAWRSVHLKEGDVIVDIGSNDATLLKEYGFSSIVSKVGFDPVKKFAKYYKEDGLTFVPDYFSKEGYSKLFKGKKAKIITAISMFYDLDDPNTFVSDVASVLDEEGVFVVQQNYLYSMLEKCAFDNIVHEHLEYYSLESMNNLLRRHGLKVYHAITNNINGGSFRIYVVHEKNTKATTLRLLELEEYESENDIFMMMEDFSRNVQKVKDELFSFIERETKRGKKVYVYGASTRGNTLLQYCGLDSRLIEVAVERNPEKWGKIYASVDIPIISEKEAREKTPDYFLVLPWHFKEGIVKREEEYIQNGGSLLFPLPTLTIVNAQNYGDFTKHQV